MEAGLNAGLLGQLARRGVRRVLVGLDETARQRPAPRERVLPPLDEQHIQRPGPDREHAQVDGHGDRWITPGVVCRSLAFGARAHFRSPPRPRTSVTDRLQGRPDQDAGSGHLGQGSRRAHRVHSGVQSAQHRGGEPQPDGIQRRGAHAVVAGDADDVEVEDAGPVQHVSQPLPRRGGALERRIGRRILALAHRLHGHAHLAQGGREAGVHLRACGLGHAMLRPGALEVRLGGEVAAVVAAGGVPVLAGHDHGVAVGILRQHFPDPGSDRITTGDGEGSPLTEVGLDIDDQQRTRHDGSPSSSAIMAGGPEAIRRAALGSAARA